MSDKNSSYRQIVKSTGIFGGSQIITVIIGFLRNKLIAILLGKAGLGVISMYQSIIDAVKSITSFGVETGGVREIAAHSEVADKKLYQTIAIVDKLVLLFASLSVIVCVVFSYPISIWVFNDSSYTPYVALLSISLFFNMLATGQAVVLQGLRHIGYMVKSAIWWNVAGLIVSIPLYYYFRLEGIIPVFIAASIGMYFSAYHYRLKLEIPKVLVSYKLALTQGFALFRLGFFIILASILSTVSFLIIRAYVNSRSGGEWVGVFQAIWTITNVSLTLILRSMGSDFYPRLCSVNESNERVRKLVNEQSHIVLIVSTPLIILLLLCSGLALQVLYSADFLAGTATMRWQILGTFVKVISWPLGFILLARGKGKLFLISEAIYFFVYVGAVYVLYPTLGFESLGIAYLVAYILYLPVVFLLGKHLSQFGWQKEVSKLALISLMLILIVFCMLQFVADYAFIVGIPLFILSVLYSFATLNRVVAMKSILEIFLNKLKRK